MEKNLKIFLINKKLYLAEDENVSVGDTAILTVNEQFPNIVECKSDDQIKLFQESKLSQTKRYKVLESPNMLDDTFLSYFDDEDGNITVKITNGKIVVL